MKITLQTNALLAALECSAKKDIRYYLMGISIQIKKPNVGMVYGTDGHILFAGQLSYEGHFEPLSIIVPLEVIKKIDKKRGIVDLERVNGEYFLDGVRFVPVDGTFPDVARVIPELDFSVEQKPADYNPDLLMRARAALALYTGFKKTATFPLIQRGNDSAVMHAGQNECLVVIMPIRAEHQNSFVGFNRDFM